MGARASSHFLSSRCAASRAIDANAIAVFVEDAGATTNDGHLVDGERTEANAAARARRRRTAFFDVSPDDLEAFPCDAEERAFTPTDDRQVAEHRCAVARHLPVGDRDDVSLRFGAGARRVVRSRARCPLHSKRGAVLRSRGSRASRRAKHRAREKARTKRRTAAPREWYLSARQVHIDATPVIEFPLAKRRPTPYVECG